MTILIIGNGFDLAHGLPTINIFKKELWIQKNDCIFMHIYVIFLHYVKVKIAV